MAMLDGGVALVTGCQQRAKVQVLDSLLEKGEEWTHTVSTSPAHLGRTFSGLECIPTHTWAVFPAGPANASSEPFTKIRVVFQADSDPDLPRSAWNYMSSEDLHEDL
jgi:hypothetical protein